MELSSLPPEIQQMLDSSAADVRERFDAFSAAIAAKRKEAIDGRSESGIEWEWGLCEDSYLCVDDLNRGEFARARWMKPTIMDGPVRAQNGSDSSMRSTMFVRLTARYVDAGTAKLGEITLPVDNKVFTLEPTPVPDLVQGMDDDRPITDGGQQVMRPAGESDMPQAQPGQPVPLKVSDLAKERMDKASKSAERAESRIRDWLTECGHVREVRKVQFDGARIGVGVLKGPVPDFKKAMAVTRGPDGSVDVQIEHKLVPITKWVDPWNFYPDPACGENIHDGAFLLETDFLSRAKLQGLKRKPNYLAWAIEKVLREGPGKCNVEGGRDSEQEHFKRTRYQIWHFYGEITLDELALANPAAAHDVVTSRESKQQDNTASVFAIVTMVNDTVIRCVVNPLESGSFPYHVFNWRRRAGHWAGIGVAEQARSPQLMINGATRAMLNNAGKSSDVITVMNKEMIEPPRGNDYTITPGKVFFGKSGVEDVRKAFEFYEIPNTTQQLMELIEYAFKMAEESTNIPLISQGQSGDTTPDTFGATQIQNNNANQLLRDVGFSFADDCTNPLIEQMYEWLLIDPDVPADEKGDFQVNVNASIAIIERAIQDLTIQNMVVLLPMPDVGIDPFKWFEEYCHTKRLDPSRFQFTPEEMEQRKKQTPPVPDNVQAAQIQAKARIDAAQIAAQVMGQRIKTDTDRDTAYVQAETNRDANDANHQMELLKLQREIAQLTYHSKVADIATKRGETTDKVKADLAKTVMELNMQKELATQQHEHEAAQVANAPAEPPGKAPAGKAFTE